MQLADRDGLSAVSMRGVADELGVRAMSLYGNVESKDTLLTAMVDRVYEQMRFPDPAGDWRPELGSYASSSRLLFRRHAWAIELVARQPRPGPSMLRHHGAVLGTLLAGRLSLSLARHAFAAVTSYITGFVLAESSTTYDISLEHEYFSGVRVPATDYPHFVTVLDTTMDAPFSFDTEGSRFVDHPRCDRSPSGARLSGVTSRSIVRQTGRTPSQS